MSRLLRPARAAARRLLRLWYRTGRKLGWHYRLVEKFGPRLAESRPLISRLPNRARVECDLREQIPRLIYFLGVYESPEAFVFHRLARPGWTVVDAGANLGQYTLLAASAVGPSGRVYSFEPVPATADLLRRNVALNPGFRFLVTQAALWHEAATLRLGLSGENAFVSGGFSVGVRGGIRQVAADALAFDDFAAARGIAKVDLVKMDIEGAELFALRGMRRVLRRDHPLILIEICRLYAERLGYAVRDLWDLLVGEFGYRALAIGDSAAACRPLDGFDGIEQENVLFHAGPLPEDLLTGWTSRDRLRWSRAGWR